MAASGEIVLVAGVTYPTITSFVHPPLAKLNHGLQRGEWRQLCLVYAKAIAKRDPGSRFTMFDVYTGIVSRFGGEELKKLKDPGAPMATEQFELDNRIAQFARPNPQDYCNVRTQDGLLVPVAQVMPGELKDKKYLEYFQGFHELKPRTLDDFMRTFATYSKPRSVNIEDVYEYIQSGSIPMASTKWEGDKVLVNQLHFFCHSFYRGPILLNSPSFGTTGRFEADADGRAEKDFVDGGPIDLTTFKKCFSPQAFSVLWGCNGVDMFEVAIKQALKKTLNCEAIPFYLDYDQNMKVNLAEFHGYFGVPSQNGLSQPQSQRSVTMNVRQLAYLFYNAVQVAGSSYAEELGKASGCPVYAIPPGTSSEYDTNPSQKSTKLMHAEDLTVCKFHSMFSELPADFGLRIGDINGEFNKDVGRGYLRYPSSDSFRESAVSYARNLLGP